MKKFFLSITPALLILVFLLPAPVSAQTLDLTVSPVALDYSPRPGNVIKDKAMVHNNTSLPMVLDLSVSKITVDDTGQVVPEELSPDQAAASWIKFDKNQITAPVREWLEIPFTINVPEDAAYGNYFAIVFSPPAVQPGGGSAAVQGKVLIPILLNIQSEGAVREAKITDFKADNFVSQYLPVNFSVTVENIGNMHVHPRGNIFIRGTGQKDLAILEVNPGMSNILPTASRTFTAGWADGFLVRDGSGKLNINWNKLTDFRVGKYTAYVLLSYDNGTKDVPIDSTITFWVFPYVAVGIILAVLVTVILLIVYVFKALVKKEARKIKS